MQIFFKKNDLQRQISCIRWSRLSRSKLYGKIFLIILFLIQTRQCCLCIQKWGSKQFWSFLVSSSRWQFRLTEVRLRLGKFWLWLRVLFILVDLRVFDLESSDACGTANKSGVCVKIEKCAIKQDVRKFDICSFDGKVSLICCPTTAAKRREGISQLSKNKF